jgi:hypothetical protein
VVEWSILLTFDHKPTPLTCLSSQVLQTLEEFTKKKKELTWIQALIPFSSIKVSKCLPRPSFIGQFVISVHAFPSSISLVVWYTKCRWKIAVSYDMPYALTLTLYIYILNPRNSRWNTKTIKYQHISFLTQALDTISIKIP